MAHSASIAWFARHELRLAWRDWLAMATGGKRVRGIALAIALALFASGLHWLANLLIAPWAAAGISPDKQTLVLITGGGFLFWTVMLSQALESVTRAYYGRSDLDLILSSPASSRRLFAVRTGAIAFTIMGLACLLGSPLVNTLALLAGPQWLAAYGVLAALGALATAISVLVTIGLFRLFGPRRTRLIAQIIAGVVGAGFVIGIQAAAILAYGDMSRFSILQSAELVAAAPDLSNALWWPARAAMGDPASLATVSVLGFGALAAVIAAASASFGRLAIAAVGASKATRRQQQQFRFRPSSHKQALRLKEWKLLARDPWLLSQTLMQILYLLPPALLLWVNYGESTGIFVVVVPVLVMASGQLAGGLAWLAISGEDAHDLVVTAPVSPRIVLVAKIEAVLSVLALILLPLLVLIAVSSIEVALLTGLCAALAAGSATAIQLWFRTPMRRSMFRRRQVASRMATISEAFASIMWAGTAALLVAGSWIPVMAVLPALIALGVLGLAWALSPKGKADRPASKTRLSVPSRRAMHRLTYRSATASDLLFIVGLIVEDSVVVTEDDPAAASGADYVAALAAIDADPNQQMLIAELAGEPVGCFQLTFIPGLMRRGMWRGLVENVHIAAGHRNNGLGGEMMQFAVERCRERGCGMVQLTSNKKRADAHRFYRRLGFQQSHEGFKLML